MFAPKFVAASGQSRGVKSSGVSASSRSINTNIANGIRAASLLTSDLFALIAAVVSALGLIQFVRYIGLEDSSVALGVDQLRATLPELVVIAGPALIYFVVSGHYSKRRPFWSEMREIIQVSFFALLSTGFMEFAFRLDGPRQLLVASWALFAVVAVIFRSVVRRALLSYGIWQINVLAIGDSPSALRAFDELERDSHLGYRVTRILSADQLPPNPHGQVFQNLLTLHGASHLALALDLGSELARCLLASVVRERINFLLVPKLPGVPVFCYDQISLFCEDTVVFSYQSKIARPFARAVKVLLDLVGAIVALTILSVPMLVISVLVSLDGGPVIFQHERIGSRGQAFRCFKFRTMTVDADRALEEYLQRDAKARADWNQTQKLSWDPRVTRVGTFLRATSLDELPQLFNILRLEMSLVGPRPIVMQEVQRYGEDIAYYYESRPGLTGLWQVSGRSNTTYDRRVQLDCWYVRNWSVWHDVVIILKTIPTVIGRQGAR